MLCANWSINSLYPSSTRCCLLTSSQRWTTYFGLVGTVVAHPLPVLVHFTHQHFPRAEVKSAQVHGAAQVASQLGFAAELLPTGAGKAQKKRSGGRMNPSALQHSGCFKFCFSSWAHAQLKMGIAALMSTSRCCWERLMEQNLLGCVGNKI